MKILPVLIAIAAAVIALGVFVYVADAPAYAGTDPSTCNNCHVMDAQYENWYHASHEKAATCAESPGLLTRSPVTTTRSHSIELTLSMMPLRNGSGVPRQA